MNVIRNLQQLPSMLGLGPNRTPDPLTSSGVHGTGRNDIELEPIPAATPPSQSDIREMLGNVSTHMNDAQKTVEALGDARVTTHFKACQKAHEELVNAMSDIASSSATSNPGVPNKVFGAVVELHDKIETCRIKAQESVSMSAEKSAMLSCIAAVGLVFTAVVALMALLVAAPAAIPAGVLIAGGMLLALGLAGAGVYADHRIQLHQPGCDPLTSEMTQARDDAKNILFRGRLHGLNTGVASLLSTSPENDNEESKDLFKRVMDLYFKKHTNRQTALDLLAAENGQPKSPLELLKERNPVRYDLLKEAAIKGGSVDTEAAKTFFAARENLVRTPPPASRTFV